MSHKLQIKAFFFNAKTDYLPYHKKFSLTVEDNTTVKELLGLITEQNWDFSFPKQKLIMNINGFIVEAKETVGNIVEKLGTELTIDPANSYRSNNGLKMNDDDFMQSFALLESYATEEDLKYYKTLYALHYASETEKFDHEYIGDAILLLAHKMIKDGNENKEEILTAITSAHSGLLDCEYENNLFNAQEHTETINELKAMLNNNGDEHPSLLDMIMSYFGREKVEVIEEKPKREIKTIENLKEKNIAYYAAGSTKNANVISQMILDMGTNEIATTRSNKLSGLTILEANKTLAYKKAAATLLDAFDAGTEVLVVEDVATLDMFNEHYADIEKTIGREIIGLELISAEDFVTQASSVEA